MAAQTYNTIQTAVLAALAQAPGPAYTPIPADFAITFPQAISYAENRIYRDVVMLCERKQNATLFTTAGTRTVDITALSMLVVEAVALITPANTTNPATAGAECVTYDVSSLDVIDILWPQQGLTIAPAAAEWLCRLWAMLDDHTIVIAGTPDAKYYLQITGMAAPPALSNANQSTYLSTNYPDILECAIMVFMSGWLQRNYGASADDPKMAQSWENQYGGLLAGVVAEEKRRRGIIPDLPPPPPREE